MVQCMNERRRRVAAIVAAVVLLVLGLGAFGLTTRAVQLTRWAQQRDLEAVLVEHEVFETDRGGVHRYSGGEGDVLVLIHGFSDSASGWSQVAPTLAQHYRLVTLDLPGHGVSGPDTPPLGFHDLQAGLDAALQDQGDQLILLGNSLGGFLAMRFAIDHPERVQRLLLLNSGGASWAQVDEEVLFPKTREQQRAKNRAILGTKAPSVPDFLLDQMIERMRDPRFQSLWIDLQEVHYLDEQLPELRVPIDMLWGTPDPLFPVEGYADRLVETLPNAQLHRLDGCGHAAQYSCPDALTELVLEVLAPDNAE